MSLPQKTREYRLPKVNGFHNLTLQDASIAPLKSTEVLVEVHAVSVQYRDIAVATGQYPFGQKENPVPGSDLAGEIIAVGEEVKGWKEIQNTNLGAPADGVLTEYKILPAHSLVRIPEHLSYEEASTLPCAALTAYNALLGSTPFKGGDTVLVQGTGGVSIFGLQFAFAVASGAIVIATSSSDKKLEVAKKLGTMHVMNYKQTPDWDKEVLKLTSGRGVDHILGVGGPSTIIKSVNAARYGGHVNLIGPSFAVGPESDVNQLPGLVLSKAIHMRGILIGSRSQFEAMNRLISAVKLKPVVDSVFDFEHVRKAYEYQESQQHVGKVVVKVSKSCCIEVDVGVSEKLYVYV